MRTFPRFQPLLVRPALTLAFDVRTIFTRYLALGSPSQTRRKIGRALRRRGVWCVFPGRWRPRAGKVVYKAATEISRATRNLSISALNVGYSAASRWRGKWLGLLSEIAPGLKRAAIMFNPDTAPVSAHMPSLETAARTLKVEPIIASVHSDVEIETAMARAGRRLFCHTGCIHASASRADHIGGGRTGGLWAIRVCQRRRLAFPTESTG
jgi:hypothetical protein